MSQLNQLDYGNLMSTYMELLKNQFSAKIKTNEGEEDKIIITAPYATNPLVDFSVTYLASEVNGLPDAEEVIRKIKHLPTISFNRYGIIYGLDLKINAVFNNHLGWHDDQQKNIHFQPIKNSLELYAGIMQSEEQDCDLNIDLNDYPLSALLNGRSDLKKVFQSVLEEHRVKVFDKEYYLIKANHLTNIREDYRVTYDEHLDSRLRSKMEKLPELQQNLNGILINPDKLQIEFVFNMGFAEYDFNKKQLIYKDAEKAIQEIIIREQQRIIEEKNRELIHERMLKEIAEMCNLKVLNRANFKAPPDYDKHNRRGSMLIMYASPVPRTSE